MIRSLRGRLYVGLTAIILLTGAIGSMFAYRWAFGEAIELQDSILIQLASLAQNASFSGGQPLHGVEEDTEVWLIELGKTPRGSADDRQLFTLQDGLQVATWKNQPVRVLLRTRPDGSRFAVAQPTAIRDETARDVAFRTLLPIAALIPCLMVVTALVIAYSLRPMVRLAGDLDARRADDMTPLPLSAMPSELQPFITSINGLLARMRLLMDQQRRFVADAAHELRTPITALSLQAENLASVALPKRARERVAALRLGMHRTKHLLEQLLALARHEAAPTGLAEKPLAALDHVAKEVVADLLPEAADRGIDLGFALVEPLTVRGEPAMLAAIIRNLLENALRFTPRGGTIDIGVYREDGMAILQVEDTGPGIASADMDQVFEPFFRGSRPEGEGTGLGLSIVKRIVDSLGGRIALENIAGIGRSGLRATVRLPIAGDPDSSPSKGKESRETQAPEPGCG
ncbi:HAMP domain-containing sensor histidine kinase [Bradyrhizobium sp. CCGUVB23]|uniref:sensor histidine kinase n=1 Tax=Bradyrhizobium sp. CCGUVB23 TaxID=2949630 RepID=UPI0020B1A21E|nr:ATP-binding protein [Bradyrhizobium sp. CCGUVB23]MCP3462931.1 ATP-binding protein [Bradyrhizobium sp. CCGUVB23]